MSYTLRIKVLENCPNRDMVLDYYRNKIETTSYQGDSGVDLIIPSSHIIVTNDVIKCGLGIACELIPNDASYSVGFFLSPRSSLTDEPIILTNSIGIIDAGYRGELKAPFRCFADVRHPSTLNNNFYEIKQGSRFVQIVAPDLRPIKIKLVDELSNTDRGTRGFGSTNTTTLNNPINPSMTMMGQ
jgi:dUTP pyrophosphatase